MPIDLSRQAPVARNVLSKSYSACARESFSIAAPRTNSTPNVLERLDLLPYDRPRQPIGGYGMGQHATGLAHGIEDGHAVAGFAQVVGSSKARRTGAHDRYALARQLHPAT